MLPQISQLTFLANQALLLVALPAQERLARWIPQSRFYDVQVRQPIVSKLRACCLTRRVFRPQGHRGGRGNTVENTLPSFAW